MNRHINLETAFDAYVTCALWSSVNEEGRPLDAYCCASDVDPDTLKTMREDVNSFVAANLPTLQACGLNAAQIGHDFWLTRNGHGAGFWDRGLGTLGDTLTTAAHACGEVDLYISKV